MHISITEPEVPFRGLLGDDHPARCAYNMNCGLLIENGTEELEV